MYVAKIYIKETDETDFINIDRGWRGRSKIEYHGQ
jgi:hypothetical protein